MFRSPLLAMIGLAFSLALAVPTLPAAPADPQCAANEALLVEHDWDIICGLESSCGAGSICTRAVGRDALGDFFVCRCSGSDMSKCCQLILRASTRFPEAMGSCSDCGQSGECTLSATVTSYKAKCGKSDVERS